MFAAKIVLIFKCIYGFSLFANVQYCRHLLQIPQYKSIRYIRKLNIPIEQSKLPININVEAGDIRPSKLWKQLGFAVTVSK